MVRIVSLAVAVIMLLCCSASGIANSTGYGVDSGVGNTAFDSTVFTADTDDEPVYDTTSAIIDETAQETEDTDTGEKTEKTEAEIPDGEMTEPIETVISNENVGTSSDEAEPTEQISVMTEEPMKADTEETVLPDESPVITVLPELTPSDNVDYTKSMVAITFDDGPAGYTDRLLDILKANGAKATFFVVGSNLEYHTDTLRRITDEGHDIGGHSMTHRELIWVDKSEVIYEIQAVRDRIRAITGVDSYLMRLPYGSFNDEVKAAGAEAGVAFVNWSVDTLDWKLKNADAVCDRIMQSVSDGAVILCHDIHGTTVDAMEKVIPKLIESGYQLVTFTELMAGTADRLESGRIYNRR